MCVSGLYFKAIYKLLFFFFFVQHPAPNIMSHCRAQKPLGELKAESSKTSENCFQMHGHRSSRFLSLFSHSFLLVFLPIPSSVSFSVSVALMLSLFQYRGQGLERTCPPHIPATCRVHMQSVHHMWPSRPTIHLMLHFKSGSLSTVDCELHTCLLKLGSVHSKHCMDTSMKC